ncbi:MAG: DUF2905 domain-containing protein [bacterium]|nr:DUF2905 domain-containing protein [bacterium]
MDIQSIGRVLLLFGVILLVIGGLFVLLGGTGLFERIGSLPGDIRIQGSGFTCLIPIVSSLLISLILTIVLNVIIRILNRP